MFNEAEIKNLNANLSQMQRRILILINGQTCSGDVAVYKATERLAENEIEFITRVFSF